LSKRIDPKDVLQAFILIDDAVQCRGAFIIGEQKACCGLGAIYMSDTFTDFDDKKEITTAKIIKHFEYHTNKDIRLFTAGFDNYVLGNLDPFNQDEVGYMDGKEASKMLIEHLEEERVGNL